MKLASKLLIILAIIGHSSVAKADTAVALVLPPQVPFGQIAVPVQSVPVAPVVAAPAPLLVAPYAAPVAIAPLGGVVAIPAVPAPQPLPGSETVSYTYPQYAITVNCIRRVSTAPAVVRVIMTANWVGGASREISSTQYSGDGTYIPEQIQINADRMMEDCKRGMELAYRNILQEIEIAARAQQVPPAKTY